MTMKPFIAAMAFVALSAAVSHSGEVIVWYDSQGQAHTASSPDEIPPEHRPQASGITTTLGPAMAGLAISEGGRIGSDPLLYAGGTGLFQSFTFEVAGGQHNGYLFVGTKYNLVRAAACEAARKGKKPPASYTAKVNGLAGLPVAFYSAEFKPVLMLLMQDEKIVRGEEGFEKGADPGLAVPAYANTFPYDMLDFSRPAQLQLYNREGDMVELRVNLPGYK